MTPLHQIADIRMGITFRGRDATRESPDGSCQMVRIGDITDDGELATLDFPRFEPADSLRPELFLRPGDVLFPNRGTRTTAHALTLDQPGLVAGAQFYILRPRADVALPAYVAWFLRTPAAARHFSTRRKGSLVQTVERADIAGLELPLPPLDRQAAIVALDRLAARERALTANLVELRTVLLQTRLLQAAAS